MRWVMLLVGMVTLAGCGRKPPEKKEAPPVEVIITSPQVEVVGEVEEFTGYTKAVKMVEIRSRVSGYMLRDIGAGKEFNGRDVFKEKYEGKDVKEGTVLFQIDPDPFQAELDKAEATARQVEATLARISGDLRRAKAAGRSSSPEEVERLTSSRDEAESSLRAARATRKTAALNLGFTTIRAPFSGRLSKRSMDPGNLVKADETILTTLVSLDPINAYFDIDERTVLKLRRLVHDKKIPSARDTQLIVRVGLADEEGFSREGTIDFIDNQLDAGTGTLRIRAKIANPTPEGARTPLLSAGMFVRIQLPVGTPAPTTLVPEEALGSDQGQRFLWVVRKAAEGKHAGKDVSDMLPVKVGQLENGKRVVRGLKGENLDTNLRIVVAGQLRVRLGEPVTAVTREEKARRDKDGK